MTAYDIINSCFNFDFRMNKIEGGYLESILMINSKGELNEYVLEEDDYFSCGDERLEMNEMIHIIDEEKNHNIEFIIRFYIRTNIETMMNGFNPQHDLMSNFENPYISLIRWVTPNNSTCLTRDGSLYGTINELDLKFISFFDIVTTRDYFQGG